jgi:putative FmdB family regulatory protein
LELQLALRDFVASWLKLLTEEWAVPIYEYKCQKCESQFEKLVKSMNDGDEKIACPECGSIKTARTLSVFAVGAEAGSSKTTSAPAPGMCGRCGGPGPCAMGD